MGNLERSYALMEVKVEVQFDFWFNCNDFFWLDIRSTFPHVMSVKM
jgi:hypothetical protein